MIKILIGVVVVTIAVIGTFLILDPNVGITQTNAPVTEVDNNTMKVSVSGEVYDAREYTLSDGATMSDLLEAAGGVKANADSRAYYETATLTNGMDYYIPSIYDINDVCNNNAIEKVNVNSDDAATLAGMTGINNTIANAIVTYRNENGLFSTIEQLMEVYGIGAATYKKIRNYVILHA